MPIHVTDLNDHRNLTLEDFGRLIAGRPRARLGDLTLQEICQVPLRPHGIYFMYATDGALWRGTISPCFSSAGDTFKIGWEHAYRISTPFAG